MLHPLLSSLLASQLAFAASPRDTAKSFAEEAPSDDGAQIYEDLITGTPEQEVRLLWQQDEHLPEPLPPVVDDGGSADGLLPDPRPLGQSHNEEPHGCAYYYPDQDGDGWGDSAPAQYSCSPIPGWVPNPSDCDDADPTTHPFAFEQAGDCIDQNCDGAEGRTVPDDYATIQAAVNAADPGDAVCIADGVHLGSVNVTKDLTLYNPNGPGHATLDAGGASHGLRAYAGAAVVVDALEITGATDKAVTVQQGADLVLQGVLISGNHAVGTCRGTALYSDSVGIVEVYDSEISNNSCSGVSVAFGGMVEHMYGRLLMEGVRIDQNTVTGNGQPGSAQGGAIRLSNSDAVLTDVQIYATDVSNFRSIYGAGLHLWTGSDLTLERVDIRGNVGTTAGGWPRGAGLHCRGTNTLRADNFIVAGNQLQGAWSTAPRGVGMYLEDCESYLFNGVIQGNKASYVYGGIGLHKEGSYRVNLHNTAVTDNTTSTNTGNGIYVVNDYANLLPRYNLVFGNTGAQFASQSGARDQVWFPLYGNLNVPISYAFPFMNNIYAWDFHLAPGSNGINQGEPTMQDNDGSRADIGAYGGPDGHRW